MKNIYILSFIIALTGCSDKSQDKVQNSSTNEPHIINSEENGKQTIESKNDGLIEKEIQESEDTAAIVEKTNNVNHISCSNKNITKWYGFDEASAEPACDVVSNLKLQSYKCNISKNAFGENKDAILLENEDHRIFVYFDLKDCNNILDIRNSNAP
ncbi:MULTISPECIES: hypothetical protein [Acinetobacter]|uniref:Lipoprotein n=1 Tax=Acinetobacter pseudolwoffii TaxID=2053287 RepID=N9M3I2_9GAMM|nr:MULTISPECIES: hypothetical protein [Acinetobacter]ENW85271.1 hypothetical protein F906_02800 [Acinetobacter pseudolwoffii]MCP0912502.1 hypothetical protein [Acinetobacter pseudolwoffii]